MRTLQVIALACATFLVAPLHGAEISDAEIRELLIRQSIAAYPGNCPCPYSINAAGRRCGASSAYSKPRGPSPLCYPADVSDAMVELARQRS